MGRQMIKAVVPAGMVKDTGTTALTDEEDVPQENFHPLMSTELPAVPVVP